MICQTDKRLTPAIQKYGCYFLSILLYREYYQGLPWTADEINKAFAACILKGFVGSDGYVVNPQGICDLLNIKLTFVGKAYPKDFVNNEKLFVICCWKMNASADEAHFVSAIPNASKFTADFVLFDTWDGGSKTVAEGLVTSLRIFSRS